MKKSEFFIFLTILSLVATYFTLRPKQTPTITISGMRLGQTLKSAESQLAADEFRGFHSGRWEKHWYKQGETDIYLGFEESGLLYQIKGGHPEIDGQDVSDWSLSQIQSRLGPAEIGGGGRAVGEDSHGFVAYPELHLLVQRGDSTRFILFEGVH